jgi:hypothetical protein
MKTKKVTKALRLKTKVKAGDEAVSVGTVERPGWGDGTTQGATT